MISVSIFALRDVIHQVQLDYKVSYNSTSHTSPFIDADIKELCQYLQLQQLQAYNIQRENNTFRACLIMVYLSLFFEIVYKSDIS